MKRTASAVRFFGRPGPAGMTSAGESAEGGARDKVEVQRLAAGALRASVGRNLPFAVEQESGLARAEQRADAAGREVARHQAAPGQVSDEGQALLHRRFVD